MYNWYHGDGSLKDRPEYAKIFSDTIKLVKPRKR